MPEEAPVTSTTLLRYSTVLPGRDEAVAEGALQDLPARGAGEVIDQLETIGKLAARETVRRQVGGHLLQGERPGSGATTHHGAGDLAGRGVRKRQHRDLGHRWMS